MKFVMLGLYSFMIIFTIAVVSTREEGTTDALVWATDPNPARNEQMALFLQEWPEHEITIDPDNTGKQKVMVQSLAGQGPDFFDHGNADLPAYVQAGVAMDLSEIIALGQHPDPSAEAFADNTYFRYLVRRYEKAIDALASSEADDPEAFRRNSYMHRIRQAILADMAKAEGAESPPAYPVEGDLGWRPMLQAVLDGVGDSPWTVTTLAAALAGMRDAARYPTEHPPFFEQFGIYRHLLDQVRVARRAAHPDQNLDETVEAELAAEAVRRCRRLTQAVAIGRLWEFEATHPDIMSLADAGDFAVVLDAARRLEFFAVDAARQRAAAGSRKELARRWAVWHGVKVGRRLDPDRLWPMAQETIKVDDRVFAYPCNMYWTMFAYHRDHFDAANLDYPADDWSWNDFLDTARNLTERDPATGRVERFGTMGIRTINYAYSMGVRFYNETKTRCTFFRPGAVEAIQFSLDLRDRYHVMPTQSERSNMTGQGGWGGGSMNLFGSKKASMVEFGRYGRINWRLMNEQARKKGKTDLLHIGFAPSPRGREQIHIGGTRNTAINAGSSRRFAAVDFAAFLGGEDYGRQINWSADCIPGPREYSQTLDQLCNPQFPEERETAYLWRDMAEDVITVTFASPFLPQSEAANILKYHFERISNRLGRIDEELRLMEAAVNQAIERNVREHPELRPDYEKALARQKVIDAGRTPSP